MKWWAPTARGGAGDLLVGRLGAPEGDVLAHRAAEQERLLGHHPHLGAQRVGGHIAQVVAVDQDAALGRVIEARHELDEGRLARARLAHQRHGLPGRDRHVDVAQRVLAVRRRRSGRTRPRSCSCAAQRRQLGGRRGVGELGLLVEELEDLVQGRHARLVGRVELGELLDRVKEVVQRGDEREHDAGRGVAVEDLDSRR